VETQNPHIRAVVPLRFKLDLAAIYQRVTQRARFTGTASSGQACGPVKRGNSQKLAYDAAELEAPYISRRGFPPNRAPAGVAKQQGWLES